MRFSDRIRAKSHKKAAEEPYRTAATRFVVAATVLHGMATLLVAGLVANGTIAGAGSAFETLRSTNTPPLDDAPSAALAVAIAVGVAVWGGFPIAIVLDTRFAVDALVSWPSTSVVLAVPAVVPGPIAAGVGLVYLRRRRAAVTRTIRETDGRDGDASLSWIP
ncbi:hypothetical protein ACNS7O_14560 [Haloferacaceae archaeon DSL9]